MKSVVYTACTAGYDYLRPVPKNIRNKIDFVCFSNAGFNADSVRGWSLREMPNLREDLTRACRYIKLHPHYFFADYNVSIWVDANISFNENVYHQIEEFVSSGKQIASFAHPVRRCIYDEADECKKRQYDTAQIIEEQMAVIRKYGYPPQQGLTETSVLFRKHNQEPVREMMDEWWAFINQLSFRDQLSFDFLVWKYGIANGWIDGDLHGKSDSFRRGLHRSTNSFRNSFAKIEAYQMVIPGFRKVVDLVYKARRRAEYYDLDSTAKCNG